MRDQDRTIQKLRRPPTRSAIPAAERIVRLVGTRFRRLISVSLAIFFLAVAGAPHHHLDGLQDFLLDQPSDSGVVVAGCSNPAPLSGAPAWNGWRLIDDDPCPACFNNDFVSAVSAVMVFRAPLAGAAHVAVARTQPPPPVLAKDAPSRAPPSLG
jgi:hypothetical protein